MKQEAKELLLKDLCGRLPYGVRCEVNTHTERLDSVDPFEEAATFGFQSFDVSEVKPYLRPMSSMTKEECEELGAIDSLVDNVGEEIPNLPYHIEIAFHKQIDWLNEHYFDYRGLIERGLAIEVTEENDPYVE